MRYCAIFLVLNLWSTTLFGFFLTHKCSVLRQTRHNMFSGIVEDIGKVETTLQDKLMTQWDGSHAKGLELTIRSRTAVQDAYVGCSIAVNGVCLTVTSITPPQFTVGVSPETLRRSNLGLLQPGSTVNVERALRADGRNSGHFVQGHVDCTGKIVERWQEGDSLWIKVQVPSADVMKYIVPKGFICVDGTSLTVCDVHRNHGISENFADPAGWFTLMLVAHTQQNVIFPLRKEGDLVNLEVDIIGKLVEQSVSASVASMKSVVEDLATASLQSEQWIIDLERRVDELEGKLRGER